ncbi:MAG: hypothetical protein QNJ37_13510, partial [Crocosphaera sp.]|nr:hypothetical protein [Crocosphaera sp.]
FFGKFPEDYYTHRILMIEFFPTQLIAPLLIIVETVLVVALLILLVGLRVRIATVIVLIFGCFLEAWYSSVDYEKGVVILVFYIPFFMLLNNHWGDTYSLDSILNKRKYNTDINPSDSDGKYCVVPRVILIILSALFFSSAIFKFLGTWLTFPELIADFMLKQSVKASIYGLPTNSLVPFLAQIPIIYNAMRLSVLLFEAGFFLSIFSRKLRNILIPLALIFHAVNALWFVVTFTPVLVVYFLFIDLQVIREKFLPQPRKFLETISPNLLQIATIMVAVIIGILWNSNIDVRSLINLWGIIDWRTIWYPVLPLAIIWLVISIINIFKGSSSSSV